MAKNTDFAKGDQVYDKVHKAKGTVIDIVPEPADLHHATFLTVRLEDGREFHLVEGQYEGA